MFDGMPGLYLPFKLRMYIFMSTETESHEECMIWARVFDHRLYKEMNFKIIEQMINRKHFGISEYTFTALCEGDT